LIEKLDALLNEYRRKGIDPTRNLKTGLSESELGEEEKRFGLSFPEEIKDLYRWRNGCADQYAEPEEIFGFRDMGFLNADDALAAREHVKAFLSAYESAGLDAPIAADTVFPIAGFEGQ